MKTINKIALVVSKIMEVLHWFAAVLMVGVLVCSIVAGNWIEGILSSGVSEFGRSLTTYGFEIIAAGADNTVNMTAVIIFSIGAILILALMAMVFRNVYLILKTSKGETWFSDGKTPFQKNIVRMVKEIGIFYIAVPIISLIMSVVCHLVLGAEAAEISINIEGFITGILILCLSHIFSYGTQLQNDVDGLV